MNYEQILVDVADGVATVTLNSAQAAQRLDGANGLELRHALETLSVDDANACDRSDRCWSRLLRRR